MRTMAGTTDEASPLLQNGHIQNAANTDSSTGKDVIIIDFDTNDDPENPITWPQTYKWCLVALLAFMSFTVTFTCISVVPVANVIVTELNHGSSDKSASVLLVTIWELGEAFGPLLIAPCSELFGRWPLMNIANLGFIATTVMGALSQNTKLFIATRMLTGLAVASNVLNPAIVGDIFITEQRGTAMSVIMIAPLLGGAIGPAIAGALAESLGWRAILWMSVILAGSCEIIFLCCFRETYKVTILRRKAAILRSESGNPNIKTQFDLTDTETGFRKFWTSITRPFTVFFGSTVLQICSLFGSMTFTYFYILSTTLPDILEQIYHLSPSTTGVCFLSFSAGSILSLIICNLLLDRIYIRLRDSKTHAGTGKPEFRLPLVILGAITLPITIACYGWAADQIVPLPILLVTVGALGFALLLGFLPLMSYVVDAFGLYSASAMTALIVTRCLVGTFLPLTTGPLVARFGWGGGFSILGGVSLCLAPIPVLVLRYGAVWRQWSVYSRDA